LSRYSYPFPRQKETTTTKVDKDKVKRVPEKLCLLPDKNISKIQVSVGTAYLLSCKNHYRIHKFTRNMEHNVCKPFF
jgi:hypothetical protein